MDWRLVEVEKVLNDVAEEMAQAHQRADYRPSRAVIEDLEEARAKVQAMVSESEDETPSSFPSSE